MQKIPSPKIFQSFKRWKKIVTCVGGEEYTFEEGTDIFVKPAEDQITDPTEELAHRTWKAHILELRRDDSKPGQSPFMMVQWYYSPSDIKAMIKNKQCQEIYPYLGNTELLLSDHRDIVLVQCCIDDITITFFDENSLKARPIKKGHWYYRMTLITGKKTNIIKDIPSLSGCCGSIYNPDLDRQRYCPKCQAWYDEKCIGPAHATINEDDGLELLGEIPYIRGYDGSHESGNWQIVGTGNIKQKAKSVIRKGGKLSDLWSNDIGEEVIAHLISIPWDLYYCPICGDVEI
ncbi:hypothetical protein BD779DRAFT_1679196 [Infundibulicybe gibba]|nr:hypothetical protein BD779DRAFT_1679196 [Infundibulicybe gibba]